jgi:hypothetical protein
MGNHDYYPIIEIEDAIIAHAGLHDGCAWPYLRSSQDAQATLGILSGKVGFFGHTHRESVFVPDGAPLDARSSFARCATMWRPPPKPFLLRGSPP